MLHWTVRVKAPPEVNWQGNERIWNMWGHRRQGERPGSQGRANGHIWSSSEGFRTQPEAGTEKVRLMDLEWQYALQGEVNVP